MNLETKIIIYKFTPQVFTLTLVCASVKTNVPRFNILYGVNIKKLRDYSLLCITSCSFYQDRTSNIPCNRISSEELPIMTEKVPGSTTK